jgi:hypothetical protein
MLRKIGDILLSTHEGLSFWKKAAHCMLLQILIASAIMGSVYAMFRCGFYAFSRWSTPAPGAFGCGGDWNCGVARDF